MLAPTTSGVTAAYAVASGGASSSSGCCPAAGADDDDAAVAVGRDVCEQLVWLLSHMQLLRSTTRHIYPHDPPLPTALAMDGRLARGTAGLLAALLDREQLQRGAQGRKDLGTVGGGGGGNGRGLRCRGSGARGEGEPQQRRSRQARQ